MMKKYQTFSLNFFMLKKAVGIKYLIGL